MKQLFLMEWVKPDRTTKFESIVIILLLWLTNTWNAWIYLKWHFDQYEIWILKWAYQITVKLNLESPWHIIPSIFSDIPTKCNLVCNIVWLLYLYYMYGFSYFWSLYWMVNLEISRHFYYWIRRSLILSHAKSFVFSWLQNVKIIPLQVTEDAKTTFNLKLDLKVPWKHALPYHRNNKYNNQV